MRRFLKNQFSYFISGLVFWLPIAVIVIMLTFVASNFEEIGRKMLFLIPEDYLFPGLGIIFSLLIVYISGVILKLSRVRRVFSRTPILRIFFASEQVITIEQLLNLQPCLFLYSPSCISYGWLLSGEKVKYSSTEADINLVNVYYPNVPSLLTGQVFVVRKETAIRLGNPSKEIIDILLYAFRSPEYLRYLPWEGESEEDLQRRAKSFGLILGQPAATSS